MNALDYLKEKKPESPPAICVAYGDEPFLKRQVILRVRELVAEGDEDFSFSAREGKSLQWRDALDELSTVAMFGGGRRLLLVNDADDFVSANRPELEVYAEKPKATGVLLLEVTTWPKTTRLFKKLETAGLQIECKAPAGASLLQWLIKWAKQRHAAELERDAAELMVETIGPELGLLDVELAKLAVSAKAGESVTRELVEQTVVGWRARTTWEMLDLAAEGKAGEALAQLDRLIAGGETAVGLLAQMGYSLRKMAAAARLHVEAERAGKRSSLRDALVSAGVKPAPFLLNKAEAQLKQIGRHRALKLYQWLLDADLALKGQSSSPAKARIVLESLIARLARQTAQPVGAAGAQRRA